MSKMEFQDFKNRADNLIKILGQTGTFNKLKSELLRRASHELTDHIKKDCLHLETLISELDSDMKETRKIQNNLSLLIESCTKELKNFARSREYQIELNMPSEIMLIFDKDQIHHVINNILGNAIKHTPPNGVINISTKFEGDFVIIAITDYGIGFTMEEKILLSAQRYGQGFDIITEGSGLGLNFTKKIVELHGGEIWVESNGKYMGTSFYFSLPILN